MTRLFISLILFLGVFSTNAQVKYYKSHFDECNETFNEYVYLYKSIWDYLETNAISKAEIITKKDTMEVSFVNTGVYRDYMFKKIFYYTSDSTDEQTTSIILHNTDGTIKRVDASAGNIPFHKFKPLDDFAYDHLNYLNEHEIIKHEQFSLEFRNRIDEAGIDYTGIFAENIALHEFLFRPYTKLDRIMHAFRGYFESREKTDHWNELMQKEHDYKYYTTYILQDDSKGRLYSVTIMTTGEIYELKY